MNLLCNTFVFITLTVPILWAIILANSCRNNNLKFTLALITVMFFGGAYFLGGLIILGGTDNDFDVDRFLHPCRYIFDGDDCCRVDNDRLLTR